jgi:hypothetical protein
MADPRLVLTHPLAAHLSTGHGDVPAEHASNVDHVWLVRDSHLLAEEPQ